MAEGSGLFERWSREEELPEPFSIVLKQSGAKRYTTRAENCSHFNPAVKGKSAFLHPATLRALLFLLDVYDETSEGAVGMQYSYDKSTVNYYCIEYEKKEGRCAVIYNVKNGKFSGCRQSRDMNELEALLPVYQGESAGEEYLALLAYASLQEGPLWDQEFTRNFMKLQECTTDMGDNALLQSAHICCDNLYRRIESKKSVEEGGIPIESGQLMSGVSTIPFYQLKAGVYSPNESVMGDFTILCELDIPHEKTVNQLKERFYKKRQLSNKAKTKIPELPEEYLVSIGAQEILQMVEKTPARIFMITGGAGLGKTTDSMMIAQVLGLPYYKLTCGPGTDETELLVSTIPNMGKPKPENEELPSIQDFMMDPASALASLSGVYQEGIEQEDAFQQIISQAYQKGYEKAREEKDFTLVESAIIQACREPAVLEIQEPAMIENPGTLTKLNALLDDSASTDLLNGETIIRHPDTVILLTTNLNYIGCRMFNESILSRMSLIQHREELTQAQMVQRVMARTSCQESGLLIKMADIIVKIQQHLRDEEIQGGVCGYRELENWVWKYMANGNVLQAVKDTVVSKASHLPEERKEIMELYVLPYFKAA